MNLESWKGFVKALDFQPLFVTVSGAHLYGFPSPDSDVDLRGCHRLPLESVVGLALPVETVDRMTEIDGIEVDIVSHDIGKYLRLLVKNNGYVLEQIFSPLVVEGSDFLAELKSIAGRCITRHHYHHYRGFYGTQRKLIEKEKNKRAKSVLYAYRVLMTGIHLMQTGRIEANIVRLNETFQLTFIDELIAAKTSEKVEPEGLDWGFHAGQLDALEAYLDRSFAESDLGESRDVAAVNDLLVRLRLAQSQQ